MWPISDQIPTSRANSAKPQLCGARKFDLLGCEACYKWFGLAICSQDGKGATVIKNHGFKEFLCLAVPTSTSQIFTPPPPQYMCKWSQSSFCLALSLKHLSSAGPLMSLFHILSIVDTPIKKLNILISPSCLYPHSLEDLLFFVLDSCSSLLPSLGNWVSLLRQTVRGCSAGRHATLQIKV